MRYDDEDRQSKNVEDRRGQGGGFPGGGIRIPIGGGGGLSLTSLLIIGALMLFLGINPLDVLLGGGSGGQIQMPRLPQTERPVNRQPVNIPGLPGSEREANRQQQQSSDADKVFIGRVLADTEDVWKRVFASANLQYREPQLVLFSGFTRTACGAGQAQMGPFYCPLDQKVYIDLDFFAEMQRKFNIQGDFAQAYVVAHEVGHHVQTLLGIAERVQRLKSQAGDETESNQIQVRMELQADCLAGVWASLNDQVKSRLEDGDIEEALNAATQIGDDMIQRRMTGRVVPDAFTHGSAAQRKRWFETGFNSGRIQNCDTFGTADL